MSVLSYPSLIPHMTKCMFSAVIKACKAYQERGNALAILGRFDEEPCFGFVAWPCLDGPCVLTQLMLILVHLCICVNVSNICICTACWTAFEQQPPWRGQFLLCLFNNIFEYRPRPQMERICLPSLLAQTIFTK